MTLKIQLLSDLHLEFQKKNKFIPNFLGEDVLVLAGDINLGLIDDDEWFVSLLETRDVIYIFGNHELYKQDLQTLYAKLPAWTARINALAKAKGFKHTLYSLENETVTIQDVKFIGATLWTDFDNANPDVMNMAAQTMNDYRHIRYNGNVVTADDFLKEHNKSRKFIESELDKTDGLKKVVISHHLPSYGSVHPNYRVDNPSNYRLQQMYLMNYLFYSELDSLIVKSDLWVHGHTHSSMDYVVGNTRVVCNPYGYDNYEENKEFNSTSMIIEI